MKLLIIIASIVIIIIGSLMICSNLPISIFYYKEISNGDVFAKHIKQYQKENNKLPDQMDWETLQKLNPLKPYNEIYPDYKKIDDSSFMLSYIVGFDGPYLTYETKTKKWMMK